VCTEIDGVRNLFYYNPIDHTLGKITTKKRRLTSFLKHVNKVLPYHDASIIWFVANTNKTSAKYQYAESLIWRDAGAYIYCFQIVAEALKLKSCPLGTLGEPFITDLVDANNASHGVGGILVG
jgi:SagB-type dehydrogenase family enzyme